MGGVHWGFGKDSDEMKLPLGQPPCAFNSVPRAAKGSYPSAQPRRGSWLSRSRDNESIHNNAALFCVAKLPGDGSRIPAAGSEGRSLASVKPSGKSLTFATPRWSGVTAK